MRVSPLVAIFILITGLTPALAQTPCDPATSVSTEQILANVDILCCSKNKAKTKKKCLSNMFAEVRRTKGSLGEALVDEAKAEITKLKTPVCGDTVVPECTIDNEVTLDQLDLNIEASCCSLRTKAARGRCFNKLKSKLRKAKPQLGAYFVPPAVARIKAAKAADCGIDAPARESKCQVTRKNRDGYEGWLHKPVSDSTHSIVDLWPTKDDPTNCRYEKLNGKLVRQGFSSGRHNGFREHIRPEGGGFCSTFPKNMVLRCKLGNKQVCYKIPDACNRYD